MDVSPTKCSFNLYQCKQRIHEYSAGGISTKTWNNLEPPKTTYNHLKNFNNHLQPPQQHIQPLTNYLKPSKTMRKCLK